ncbi:CocE/NonD family hydrolase [Salinibacillus xinjiangensis]|uniref:CocE/NonD family hydrolase n=1 Tax=Salinibacillus xinjiangensis TaxID=1229268 RepID=A0A6G1X8U8_9BACI|nr:CocE/NonD family hydrolase [Salinibacillus xinjiangensis]MRG87367.1 CocE/NonD family hydrolase [Salinibacillus xinjiangensis]
MGENHIKVEKNIPCQLEDGTILRSDVYRPNVENGVYPVLMLRLPYDKETPRYYDEYLDVPRMVDAGYAVILQDVRGRFASDGDFYPFIHEGKDGYEAVEWAARLPFSNGKVGLFGMSYHGYTQLAAAVEHPPSLKAIAPVMTMAEPWGDILGNEGDAHAVGKFETWVLGSILEDQLKRENRYDSKKFNQYYESLEEWLYDAPAEEWTPMKDLSPDSFFFDVMRGNLAPEWKVMTNLSERLWQLEIPALFMGGWFDALLMPTLAAYKAYGGPCMLWIGPWTHEEMTGHAGERFFENAKKDIGFNQFSDTTEIHIKFFDHWLKGKPMPIHKPVQLYLMGENRWAAFDEWPISGTVRELFLDDGGRRGKLTQKPDSAGSESQLKLDPSNPVPVRGGGTLIAGHQSGMFDVSDIQERDDVLVFTSEPLEEDYQLLGLVKGHIWCSSPTAIFDISLRISDVDQSGRAYNVIDTFHREKLGKLNEPFCLDIEIGSTAYTLKKGHCLRLDIAASKAPLYDVNLNNGTTTKTHVKGEIGFETIYHGGEMDSKIIVQLAADNDA